MKNIRHFARNSIRFLRKYKLALVFYFYRNIILPIKHFLKEYYPNLVHIRTSGSDVKKYKDICSLAGTNEEIFKTFRVHKDYAFNLGEWKDDTRKIALDIINKDYSDLINYFAKFQESEKYGGPVLHQCGFGTFSDPTIRYIKTLGDIRKIFGNLDNFKIIEIGAGYGGQCKIISDVFRFSLYNIVDLPEVILLQKKFLGKLNVKNVCFLEPDKVPNHDNYDLIISNFAFAECERSIQQDYIDKILNNSKRGFIIYNFDGHPSQKYDLVRPYCKEEIINILGRKHNLSILQDYPHPPHCNPFVITWDDAKK